MCDSEEERRQSLGGQTLLFTEAEWNAAMPSVVRDMHEYAKVFSVPISVHLGDHGEAWGSGTFITVGDRVHILTCEHVARKRSSHRLVHQLLGVDEMHVVAGDHQSYGWPLDIALMPVSQASWDTPGHKSKALRADMIAMGHAPVPTEIFSFVGYPGDTSKFVFGTLLTPSTSSTAREVPLPADSRFGDRFHFGLDYRPDKAITVIGSSGLPRALGFSGSAVWNTGFVECKMAGKPWTPDCARVTGVLWGWPPPFVVATRAEFVRSFLFGAVAQPSSFGN